MSGAAGWGCHRWPCTCDWSIPCSRLSRPPRLTWKWSGRAAALNVGVVWSVPVLPPRLAAHFQGVRRHTSAYYQAEIFRIASQGGPHARALLAVLLLAFPATTIAQEAPVVVLQFWKCDGLALADLRASSDSIWIPLAQELVNEGKFDIVQMLETGYGDEWNVVYYYRSKDPETYFAAWEEWVARVNDRYAEELGWWFERCPEVKNFMYRSTVSTELRNP